MRLALALLAFAAAAAAQLTDASPPSTLLPPNTRSIEFSVRSAEPASCGYSVGAEQPYEKMVPFARGQGTTGHGTTIAGLDPDTTRVNEVWVRCAPGPPAALHLRYRSLPPTDAPFPRVGNLWGTAQILPRGLPHAARISLHLGANLKPDQIRQLRALNPHILILTSINTVENGNLPDDFYLKDTNGKRIEVWPNIYRLNLTKPKVAEFQARFAYERILKLDLMVDGCFFDNFFTTQSWLKADIHGNRVALDANEDGLPDDPKLLDKAWREGVFNELREWRRLMPHALASGHLFRPADRETMEIFNGDSIGFLTARVLEGERTFASLWDIYHGWYERGRKPVLMMIESAPHNQIAYGYDYRPLEKIPPLTLEFARTYYPYVRFGLALTLMNDGYFAHEFGDTWHGNDWWYDELDFNLGHPLGDARPVSPDVWRRDFTNGIALLNGTKARQTVKLEPGLRRLKGEQAPRHEFILDDIAPAFTVEGPWRQVVYDSGRWKSKGPFFHNWGKHCHQLDADGTAEWKLPVLADDTFTISAWWPAAPGMGDWTAQATYEVLVNGKVLATATLDQRKAGDEWHEIAKVPLLATTPATVRVRKSGGGSLIADALYLRSAARYNDGSPAREVTLEPLDGIVLQRTPPGASR
jgi:hypothetical protein